MTQERRNRLAEFTAWTKRHITGDEKGQAQIYLDRLFQALGHPGCLDVGGTPEFRIRKGRDAGGGVAFADYVWKPFVRELVALAPGPATIANASNAAEGAGGTVPKKNRFTKKVILNRFGIAENTLRAWEAKGIISPPEPDWRGWKWYNKKHLAEIEKHIANRKRHVERSAKKPKRRGGP